MQPMFVRINSLNLKVLRDLYWNINKFFEVKSWYRTMWCKSWNVLNRWSWLVVIMFWAHSVARIQHLVNVTLANHYIQTGKSRFSLAIELGCCVHCFLGWQQVGGRRSFCSCPATWAVSDPAVPIRTAHPRILAIPYTEDRGAFVRSKTRRHTNTQTLYCT